MTVPGAWRAALIALSATAAAAAAPAIADAQNIACERGGEEVRALEFRGNRALSDDDLAVRVNTTASSWARRTLRLWFAAKRCLDHDELPLDVLRLKTYYRERGYYSTQVDTSVQAVGRNAVRVVFNIDEGEPTRLAAYQVSGLDTIAEGADILRRLQLRVGRPFDLYLYRADVDTIVNRLRNVGYYHANVLQNWDTDTARVAHASITVLAGKRARFGEPEYIVTPIEDRTQEIPDRVVARVLGIRPGDRYSDRAIVDAQRNLFQLGAYQHVEVAPKPDSAQPAGDTTVILEVRLSEDYMRQIDSEIGWATLDCGRVRLQYTDKNFLKTARRLELTGQASKIGYGDPLESEATRRICTLGGNTDLREDPFSQNLHYFLGATVRQPRLLGTMWVPTVSLYTERRGEFKAFLRTTPVGGDLSASRDVGFRMPLRLGYTIEYGKTEADRPALCALFNRCDEQSQRSLGINRLATLGVASAALARIRTDNILSPTRGYTFRSEARSSASRLLGSSDSLFFNKGTADLAWYRSLGASILALRVRGGAVFGRQLSFTAPTTTVPPQERLYAGGPTSVRGFQQNELGSLVYISQTRPDSLVTVVGADTTWHYEMAPDSVRLDRSVPLGGTSLVVANAELRVRDPFLFPNLLQYTFFIDGGDVWARGKRPMTMKWTPGVGLRALTAFGPIQVNVGYNRYPGEKGPLYYNPDVTTLLCVTPGNTVTYTRNPNTQRLEPSGACDAPLYQPPARTRFFQKLTFTFSIGSDF